jgi:POT family proton-dependent oligopeptide transporter
MSTVPKNVDIGREEELPAAIATEHAGSVDDVPQLGLFAAIASLSYVFWVVGGMEMIERLAYYGVKAVATLYAKDPVSKGGLGVTMTEFGTILMIWAMVQSVLPVFTGGLSDRFGYKQTIAVSTVVKIIGYLIMATFPTYWGFFAGAIVLAGGTAVFKPGIQGTLVKATRRDNSSMAWGIFYQTVNIGGFLGPLVAGYMRKMEWRYVFLACAGIISLNFLMLLIYKEPGKAERLARAESEKAAGVQKKSLVQESLDELTKRHVWPYLLIFSGFWFMFNSLFDILPAHIEDWVDTRDVINTLRAGTNPIIAVIKPILMLVASGIATVCSPIAVALGESPLTPGGVVKFFIVMNKEGTEIQPEGLLNLNAMLIMLSCFIFAWLSGKMKAITSMVVGTVLAAVSLCLSGGSWLGWLSVGAIGVFSIGEMLSSPKFSEYIGNFAPADKKAMYLGFSQIPLAIGWTLEGKIGTKLYDHFASKDTFSRELLIQKGFDAKAADAIPKGEAFQKLCDFLHQSPHDVTAQLYATHNPGMVWYIMGGIGALSAIGIWWYGQWVKKVIIK